MGGGRGGPSEQGNPFEEKWKIQSKRKVSQNRKSSKFGQGDYSSRPSGQNRFEDQRVGENKPGLSEEDRYLARLQRERSRGSRKRKRYNLSDFLAEENAATDAGNEKSAEFPTEGSGSQDPFSILKDDFEEEILLSDSDLEDEDGRTHSSVHRTGELHKEADLPLPEVEKGGASRTHSDVMNEVMEKSKMYKALRQHEKAADEEQREKLDKGLPELTAMLVESNQVRQSKTAPFLTETQDKFNYDQVFRSLAEERRARPSTRLKTVEEKEADERNRLQALENTRRERMAGLADSDSESETTDPVPTRRDRNPKRKEATVLKHNVSVVTPKSGDNEVSADHVDAVPFFFNVCPSESSELSNLLDTAPVSVRGVIVERLLKCFATSLDPSVNGQKLQTLFRLLLDRVCELSGRIDKISRAAEEIDLLSKHLHQLGAKFPSICIEWSREQVYSAYKKLQRKECAKLSECWSVSDILVLRLLTRLFPGSDIRHCISTPLQLLLSEALSRCQERTSVDYVLGCFTCAIALEFSASSNRLSGQIVDFFCRGLTTFENDNEEYKERSVKNEEPLRLSDCVKFSGNHEILVFKIMRTIESLISAALFRGRLPSIDLIFAPVLVTLSRRSTASSAISQKLSQFAKESASSRCPMLLYTEKSVVVPKALNPKFSAVNGVYRKHSRSRMQVETLDEKRESLQRIRKALNKEERGYARELRKEALLLAQQKSENEAANEEYANAKSKELQVFLETQQATWKQAAKKQKQMSGKRW